MVLTLADMEGNETFDPAALGTADEVAEIRVADDAMVSTHITVMFVCESRREAEQRTHRGLTSREQK